MDNVIPCELTIVRVFRPCHFGGFPPWPHREVWGRSISLWGAYWRLEVSIVCRDSSVDYCNTNYSDDSYSEYIQLIVLNSFMDSLLIYPNTNIWWQLHWQQWHHKLYRNKAQQNSPQTNLFLHLMDEMILCGSWFAGFDGEKGCVHPLQNWFYRSIDRSIDPTNVVALKQSCMEKIKKSRLSSPHRQWAKSSLFPNACTYYSSVCMKARVRKRAWVLLMY